MKICWVYNHDAAQWRKTISGVADLAEWSIANDASAARIMAAFGDALTPAASQDPR